MATLSVAIKSALTVSAGWTALVTGGTYLLDDLKMNGLSPDKVLYDANGRMKLTATITWSSGAPAEIVHRTYRRFFYVRLFDDPVNGFVNIRAALRLLQLPVYDGGLLSRAQVTTDTEGRALIALANTGPEFYDEELNGACASFARLYAEYRQRESRGWAMAGTFEFGEVLYTLANIYVCRYNFVAGAYAGEVGVIAAPKKVTADYEHDTDKLSASGRNLRGLSVLKGAALTLNMGGMDFNCNVIMTGGTTKTSNNKPNRRRQFDLQAGGAGLPYFGMICTGPTDDGGLWTDGFIATKLDKVPGFELDGETNKFSMSEVGGYAFAVDYDSGVYVDRPKVFETAGDFTPPANAAAFLAHFASIT